MIGKTLRIIGFVFGYILLLVGIFLCVDAFIPKSKPIMLKFVVGEFIVGGVIFAASYLLLRYVRLVDITNMPTHQRKNMPKSLLPLGGFILMIFTGIVLLRSCDDTVHYRFKSYEELAESGLIKNKMAPAWIPTTAKEIVVAYDFDLGVLMGSATFDVCQNDLNSSHNFLKTVMPAQKSRLKHLTKPFLFYSDGSFDIAINWESGVIVWGCFANGDE